LDPVLTVASDKIRFAKALHVFNGSGTAGQVLVSDGAVAPPEWKGVGEALADEGHNFLVKPYTVYTGDDASLLVPEAPDGNFHDGELYFSTLTNELFVYGAGNWWPTAVDFQTDITRIDAELSGKLSLTGGDVTGAVTTSTAITQNKQFATKEYVDSNSGGVEVLAGNKSNPSIGDMWYNTSANVMYVRTA